MRQFLDIVADDSMSFALFGLFLLCIAAQSVTGWHAYQASLRAAYLPGIGFGAYLRTGNFLDGAFSNWQAAILQLAVLVAFSSVLRQQGAAHSRKKNPPNHRKLKWKLGRRDNVPEWLYANSLSLVLLAMFAAAFVLHLFFGCMAYNEEQALRHLPRITVAEYAGSPDFWFTVFQCWEAEFAAIGIYIVLSIFLRQEGSPESKPVGAADRETGEVNE